MAGGNTGIGLLKHIPSSRPWGCRDTIVIGKRLKQILLHSTQACGQLLGLESALTSILQILIQAFNAFDQSVNPRLKLNQARDKSGANPKRGGHQRQTPF
ncbi:hypothetical protein D9M71_710660 [compost metagenome]